ncbi:MAG: GNAT family N-acetyltransferase [Thermoleophilaceae bacterium]
MNDALVVRGPRLSLRYPTREDAPALYEIGSDPEVTRFFSWGPYTDPAQPLGYIESLGPARRAGARLEFAIVDEDDRPLGITGLTELSTRDRRAVVGTWLGRTHWGSGANTESKALVLALAFRRLGLIRATALVNPANTRSVRALERLGFRHEGVLAAWHLHAEGPQDCAIMRLMREDFEATPLGTVSAEFEGEPPRRWVAGPGYSQRK